RNGNGNPDTGESNWTNAAPTVSITSPTNGQLFVTSPTNIAIAATASDSDGVTNVAFYFNSTNFIGNDTTSPYGLTWSNVTAGAYTLVAKATDSLGGSQYSAPVTSTVNAMPSVSLTNPANGAYFLISPTNILLQASASDSDGTITN